MNLCVGSLTLSSSFARSKLTFSSCSSRSRLPLLAPLPLLLPPLALSQLIAPLPAGAPRTPDTLYPHGAHLTDLKQVRELVYSMQRPGIAPELVYTVDWKPRQLALFHNRGTLHSITGAFAEDEVRACASTSFPLLLRLLRRLADPSFVNPLYARSLAVQPGGERARRRPVRAGRPRVRLTSSSFSFLSLSTARSRPLLVRTPLCFVPVKICCTLSFVSVRKEQAEGVGRERERGGRAGY